MRFVMSSGGPRLGSQLCALALVLLAASAGQARGAADNCAWSADKSSRGIVKCHVSKLDPNGTSLSLLQTEATARLHIFCSDIMLFESNVPHFFQRPSSLQDLTIDNCKILKIGRDAFRGLGSLKQLTLTTYNAEWGTNKSLDLVSSSFDGLREVQNLDLVHNNIRSLPDDLFCTMSNLQTVNLSHNFIRDIKALGFAAQRVSDITDSVRDRDCDGGVNVRSLDLSHNHLHAIPENSGLTRLRGLQYLYLQHNDLSSLDGKVFKGLSALKVVNMSYNHIETLDKGLFSSTREVTEIYLQNNSLSVLPRGLFEHLEQLVVLDLSHNLLTSNQVDGDSHTFVGLIRLIVLNLAHNSLTRIGEGTFKDLYFLQILDLRNNNINVIEDNAFLSLYNLHTLNLGENRLHHINTQMLNGLFILSKLSLNNNLLGKIEPLAFRNCSDLKELDLSSNVFQEVPAALSELSFLKTLDLGENQITTFKNGSFRNLTQLTGLRLIENEIGPNLTIGMFWDLENLQVLNLAKNKIQFIEMGTFDRNIMIEAIRLDGNYLADINGVFTTVKSLLWLNLSENHLTWFDWTHVPENLTWLDFHGNFIEKLLDYYDVSSSRRLRTLDGSYNRIKEINAKSLPDSVEVVFINNNLISNVEIGTLIAKKNLVRIDLYSNELVNLDIGAIRLPANKTSPELYLGGNPFFCNCSMEWLQVINNMSHTRQYPRIMDLDNIMCRMQNLRGRQHIAVTEARASNFLCTYETHCFHLCQCCDFDACDCEMTCPQNCSCYHDQAWTTNVVDCSRQESSQIPLRIPMDATEVYLDGNNFKELHDHVFIGRKNMRVLFVNSSHIEYIQNRTFNGLHALEILHLEDNKLNQLQGFEFENLTHLRELYLQNNRISYIGNLTMASLKSLQVLHLEGNRLSSFPVWQLSLNPYLVEVSLGNNHWSCRCKFLQELQTWVSDNAQKVSDVSEIYCYVNDSRPPQKREIDMNSTACSDYYSGSSVIQSIMVSDYLPMMIVTLSAFLLLIVASLVVFIFRDPMRVWVYSKYGVRLFHFKAAAAGKMGGEDREKLYDGYVVYSPKDEEFVLQSIVAELEHGNPSFQLCLHYRDLPHQLSNAYLQHNTLPVVVEAAEASRRVLVVLSRNFLQTEWSRFEFRQAMHEALKGRVFKLVLVEDGSCIHEAELDPELRPYLKTGSRVRWGEKRFWERLRYAMPSGDTHRKSNSNYRRNINTYSMDNTGVVSGNHHVATHVVTDHRGYAIGKVVKQPDPAMHINSHPLFLAAAAAANHHENTHVLGPPAYSSSSTLTRTNARQANNQPPEPRARPGMDCDDANYSSATTATPSPRPLHRHPHHNGSSRRESPSPNTRPTSEHIYSSIDSDYPTFERAGSGPRRQINNAPAPASVLAPVPPAASPSGGAPLPGVHRPHWRTAGATIVENGGVQAYLV